jgi:hypothetical protein
VIHDPFGRVPDTLREPTREELEAERLRRVALLDEYVQAKRERRAPSVEAEAFVVAGIEAMLLHGGDVSRDYWRVKPRRGSKRTAAKLAKEIRRHRDDDGAAVEFYGRAQRNNHRAR